MQQIHNAACDSTNIQDIGLLAHDDPSYCWLGHIITHWEQQQ